MSDLIEQAHVAVGEQCTIRLDYPNEADLILRLADELERLNTDCFDLACERETLQAKVDALEAELKAIYDEWPEFKDKDTSVC